MLSNNRGVGPFTHSSGKMLRAALVSRRNLEFLISRLSGPGNNTQDLRPAFAEWQGRLPRWCRGHATDNAVVYLARGAPSEWLLSCGDDENKMSGHVPDRSQSLLVG